MTNFLKKKNGRFSLSPTYAIGSTNNIDKFDFFVCFHGDWLLHSFFNFQLHQDGCWSLAIFTLLHMLIPYYLMTYSKICVHSQNFITRCSTSRAFINVMFLLLKYSSP